MQYLKNGIQFPRLSSKARLLVGKTIRYITRYDVNNMRNDSLTHVGTVQEVCRKQIIFTDQNSYSLRDMVEYQVAWRDEP
jgi:hypothetical protein